MFRRAFFVAAALVPFAADAATIAYSAALTAGKEVPKVAAKGKGALQASFDTVTKVLTYTLTWEGLSGPATMAHFHGPATRKENGPHIAQIGDGAPASPVTGTLALTDDQVKALQTGKVYVNVHTAAHPDGEIRGQIVRGPGHAKPPRKPDT